MSWLTRLTNALRPHRLDHDLAEEFHEHLARLEEEFVKAGASPSQAKSAARRTFGNVVRLREDARAPHLLQSVETTWLDVRHAWRALRRRPAFALTATGLIAGATAATLAVVMLLDATMLRPLSVSRPDDLVALSTTGPSGTAPMTADPALFSYPLYEALRVGAGDSAQLTLVDDPRRAELQASDASGSSEQVTSQFVAPDAFTVLGVPARLGQLFSREDDHYPAPRAVVVLSHDYWRGRFGADPAVIGRSLIVDGRPHIVVGVAAAGFQGVELGTFVDLWRPITTFDPGVFSNPSFRSFRVIGRLSKAASRVALKARLSSTFASHQRDRLTAARAAGAPASEVANLENQSLLVNSGRTGVSSFRRDLAAPFWIVTGLAVGLLLTASANVAGLVLTRSEARSRDVALRLALGASRGRVFRLLLAEGILISIAATAIGWTLAPVLAHAFALRVPASGHSLQLTFAADWRLLIVIAAIGMVTCLIVGVLPAWLAIFRRPAASPHMGRQTVRATAGRKVVGVQVAFAFALVMLGGSFLVSLRHLVGVDRGFDGANVAVFTIANSLGPGQRPLQTQLMRELQTRVASQPAIQGTAAAWWALFSGAKRAQRVALPGTTLSEHEEVFYRVSPTYLATLRIPLLSGRTFTDTDNDDEPVVAVVSRAFAVKYFGDVAALGRTFVRDDGVRHQVIGVADDSRYDSLRGEATPIVYMPMRPPGVFTLYVRTTLDTKTTFTLVEAEARALGSGMRIRDATTLDGLVQRTLSTERILAALGGTSGAFGLVLAAFGLFGVLSHSIAARTAEIAVRVALGSSRARVLSLVLKDVVPAIGVGGAAGLIAGSAAIAWMQSLLFNVTAASPLLIGGAITSFLITAGAACALPSWRAMSVDPMVALRRD